MYAMRTVATLCRWLKYRHVQRGTMAISRPTNNSHIIDEQTNQLLRD